MYRTFLAGSPWEKIVSFFLNSATFLDTPAVSRKDCASKTGAFTFGSFLTIEKAWLNLSRILTPERNRCLWGKRPTDRHTFRRLVLTRFAALPFRQFWRDGLFISAFQFGFGTRRKN